MFAYDYPLLGAFWTMLWFFLWFAWIVLLFKTLGDVFRSDDLGGWAKALWSLFLIVLPVIGVLIYLIVHGDSLDQRDMDDAAPRQQAFQSYARESAGSGGTADELSKLADLKERGIISDAEFQQQKAKILS